MKIYFIRHTTAEDDKRNSYGGIANDSLIESGIIYAKKVAGFFEGRKIDVIYTSPYSRAKETAEIIGKNIKAQVVVIYNFRERNSYGVLSGVGKEDTKKLFPEIAAHIERMKNAGSKPASSIETLPGAEIYLELVLRIKDAFNQIFRESQEKGYKNVIIVSHGGVAWAFMREIFGIQRVLEKGEIMVLKGEDMSGLKISRLFYPT